MLPDISSPDKPGKSVYTILIVDDRFDNRYLLQALLEGNGYQTIQAENGFDAINQLKTESIDAIISDILMPEMDGFKLCRYVRENPQYAHLPFIFYTASFTELKDRNFGLSLGANEYVTKPIDPEAFIEIIKKVFSPLVRKKDQGEGVTLPNHLSFYTSYADTIGRKLDKKVIELDQQIEAVQFSEEKYKHFFKVLKGIGYLFDVGNDIPLSFEGPVEDVTGYLVEEFLNGTIKWQDILHPDDTDRYNIEKKKAESQPGNFLSIRYRILHKHGDIRWVHEIASVFSGMHQDSVMIQGAIYDNTSQIKSDEQLRISEEHYRFLFETMAEGAVYLDKNGVIIDINQSAERILGFTRDHLLGRVGFDHRLKTMKEDFSVFPEEEYPAMVTLRTGQKSTATMGVFNPQDNQYHWILINAAPIFHPGDETPFQVFTTFEDITQEHLAKNALFIREKQYRELVESISDTIFTLNKEGEITYVSPVITKNLGYVPSQIIGRHYLEFIYPDDQDKARNCFELTFQNQVTSIEVRGYNSNKKIRYLRIMTSPVLNEDKIIEISGIISDISAWKESEKVKAEYTKEIQGLLTLHLLSPETEERLFSYALHAALDITDSCIGFIAFVSREENKVVFQICSQEFMESYESDSYPEVHQMTSSDILYECISNKKPVVINDFTIQTTSTIIPKKHPQINRFLAVPILENDQVVALLATANKSEPYSEENVNSLTTLGNTLWSIINRKRADQEIKKALSQIAKNMEQFSTLNDSIRNPLTVLTILSEIIDPKLRSEQIAAVNKIDSIVTMLDQGWIQSEKVRTFLIKHYQFSKDEFN